MWYAPVTARASSPTRKRTASTTVKSCSRRAPVFAAPEGVTGQELETLYDRFASGDDFSFVEKEWEPLMAVEYRHRHNVMWFIFLFIALVIAAMAAYQHGWIG